MKVMFMEPSREHGFTLVELVLTIVILGVLVAVALPRFFNQATFEERYFHDDLISAARYAQRLSTASGCAVRLTVSAAGFSLDHDANCDLTAPSYSLAVQRPADSINFTNASVPATLTITSSHAAFFFLPQGGAVDAASADVGNATIALNSSAGSVARTINIVGATGYAYSS